MPRGYIQGLFVGIIQRDYLGGFSAVIIPSGRAYGLSTRITSRASYLGVFLAIMATGDS